MTPLDRPLQIMSAISFDPLFAVDDDHRWVHVNDAGATLLGAAAEDLPGVSMVEFVPPEHATLFDRSWEEFERLGTLEGHFLVLRADGLRAPIRYRAARDLRAGVHLITARELPGGATGGCSLTPREYDVLQHAADGFSLAAIAAELALSPGTVKTHFQNIYAKLRVHDRAAAVATALRRGLID